MVMEDYFKDLRHKIGHEEIIMPGVAGILFDDTRQKVLMEQRGDGDETLSLEFVPLAKQPKMYNQQHQLAIDQIRKEVPYGWYF